MLGLSGIVLREALVQVVRGANVDLVWVGSTANDVRNALGPPSPSRQEAAYFQTGHAQTGSKIKATLASAGVRRSALCARR